MTAVMTALGWLLTRQLYDDWPVEAEDGVSRSLARGRTPTLNDVTFVLGEMGNTLTIIVLMLVAAAVLRWRFGRWHEAAFVVLAVSTQATVFMLTQLLIERDRPGVPRLDDSPPTSSFPSGHTGASVALYGAIALVVLWHVRRPLLRLLLAALLLVLPFLVAYARLYRGMHHPTDVVASFLNGSAAVIASAWATLAARLRAVAEWRR
jgi:undecaprenyl-diphosphatase